MLQVFSCDAVTGAIVDEVPASVFPWKRRLSAGSDASAVIKLDGTYSQAALRDLLMHWGRILRFDRDGKTEYGGYIVDRPYTRGSESVQVKLTDLWGLLDRRGAWDHTAPNVEKWKETVTGSLAYQAARAVLRGRTGPPLPRMGMPVTLPGFGGDPITRTYYGYHVETVGDVLADLLDEGLDIYFQPRNISNGDFDWIMRAGPAWTSGVHHEFYVTADDAVAGFSEGSDAARVTNNARFVGEGSEVDMLVRSQRNVDSPYPLLDRISERKNVSDVGQLSALSGQDLITFGAPTTSWQIKVSADAEIDVGDIARLWFDGDPWIADGFHDRRVVEVGGNMSSEWKMVTMQPTGGA